MQIQHLQAQVYLLEADVTARHNGLDSPRTPSRGPEEAAELLHQQIDSLHSENMRLHAEVNWPACLTGQIAKTSILRAAQELPHKQIVGL